ncbi:MAG TPA: hypoxanthine phosphoribosyltransferase [Chloroflexota bacterium]|nr:hypoxanthine phosphoribosyltransferase [Chloroflexota bacterium]
MKMNIERILISQEELQSRIRELGSQLAQDYAGKNLLLLGVLKGAVVFLVDLAKAIDLPLQMDFMAVSSYGASTKSSGVVRILKDLDSAVDGRDILVVEDIIDTGLTLRYILENLSMRNPASIKVCALLVKDKDGRRDDLTADYVGFRIPDTFVVGYGLDYAELYRNLPYVAILKGE